MKNIWIHVPMAAMLTITRALEKAGMLGLVVQISNSLKEANDEALKPYLEYAKLNLSTEGEIEFDDDAAFSTDDDLDGVWVMGWHFVNSSEMERAMGAGKEDT